MSKKSITWYEVTHRNVHCIGVDWDEKTFFLEENGSQFTYQPSQNIEYTGSDYDFINKVIDSYLYEKATSTSSLEQEVRDAEAILRILPLADENSVVEKGENGAVWIREPGRWKTYLKNGLFPSMKSGEKRRLNDIIHR